jgi:hypothetical protein
LQANNLGDVSLGSCLEVASRREKPELGANSDSR